MYNIKFEGEVILNLLKFRELKYHQSQSQNLVINRFYWIIL